MSAELDKAIDGAVREMLDVEPRADLRARVIARVEAPAASGFTPLVASAFSRNRVVFAAAAAAVILLAIFVARRSEPVAPPPPILARNADVRLPSEVPSTPLPTAPIVAPARIETATRGRTPSARVVSAVSIAGDSAAGITIDPLQSIAPITVAPIEQDSIAPADLEIRALHRLSDVQIAPLQDRRN